VLRNVSTLEQDFNNSAVCEGPLYWRDLDEFGRSLAAALIRTAEMEFWRLAPAPSASVQKGDDFFHTALSREATLTPVSDKLLPFMVDISRSRRGHAPRHSLA